MKYIVFCLGLGLLFCQSGLSQIDLQETYFHDCVEREYLLHLPPGYDRDSLYPMVLLLHGFLQTGADIQVYADINSLADQEGFIVLAPNGIIGETPWGIDTHWNAGFNDEVDDLGFLNGILDEIGHHYSVDLSRMYAVGFSNGGFMAYRLACELSDRIAGIASVAGSMSRTQWKQCKQSRSVPILNIHGTADRTVKPNGTTDYLSSKRLIDFWTEQNGTSEKEEQVLPDLDLSDQTSVVLTHFTHPNEPSAEIQFYEIIDGGHTWPGAEDFPPRGHTNQDISATEVIWDFFQRHQLSDPQPISIPSFSPSSNCESPTATWIVHDQILEVHWTGGLAHWVQLRDMQGRIIGENFYPMSNWTLDISGLATSIYLLSYKQRGLVFHQKIIIR